MRFLFAWLSDGKTLEVWVRQPGEQWSRWFVSPNADNEYELHAWGRRVFAVPRVVAELLVRVLPYGPERF